MPDNLTPRERLAKIVAEETDDGRRIVHFLVQVAEGQLDSDDFKGCHRMDAAKELVKIGLTEFEDYIRANSAPRKPRAASASRPEANLSPETREAREQLAAYARELTQDGRTVIRMYAEVMDGLKNDEGFKPHHRIAAARELIKRGFDHDSARPAPVAEDQKLTTNDSELKTESDEPVDYLAIVKRVVEEVGPQEEDQEEINDGHKPDTSMWDYIHSLPQPEISEEHARIGAARFHAAIRTTETMETIRRKAPTQTGLQQRAAKIPSPLMGEG